MKISLIATLVIVACSACSNATSNSDKNSQVKYVLDSFIQSQKAEFSVSIIGPDSGSQYAHNADKHFIMMSVVKFPQAVALLHLVDEGLLSLDSTIFFDSVSLKRNTWSPFAEEHPYGDARMTLRQCLDYSVGMSDNIVCDRLYELLHWTNVTTYIQSLGIKDFNIASNYKNLNKNQLNINYTSANAMTHLLKQIADEKLLSENSRKVLLDIMKATTTGQNRLKGMLPNNTVVAHKTGTFFENDSFINALNDVGIVYLPDGRYYCISVLVNNSLMGEEHTEKAIAYINQLYYKSFLKP